MRREPRRGWNVEGAPIWTVWAFILLGAVAWLLIVVVR